MSIIPPISEGIRGKKLGSSNVFLWGLFDTYQPKMNTYEMLRTQVTPYGGSICQIF